jgi:SAM-dependent methyltransferase
LAAKLSRKARHVTGIDRSPDMVKLAVERDLADVEFLEGDYLDAECLPAEGYDFISAVAVVHHAPFDAAVHGLTRLLAPGGRLVVIGLADNGTPLDWIISAAGVPASRWHRRRNGGKSGPPGMPIEDSTMTWGEVRMAAATLLPGSTVRRHILWRYSLTWDKQPG